MNWQRKALRVGSWVILAAVVLLGSGYAVAYLAFLLVVLVQMAPPT